MFFTTASITYSITEFTKDSMGQIRVQGTGAIWLSEITVGAGHVHKDDDRDSSCDVCSESIA